MVILHIVTVSIYYDEKVKTDKQGDLNKLLGSGKFFQKINVHSLVLGIKKFYITIYYYLIMYLEQLKIFRQLALALLNKKDEKKTKCAQVKTVYQ